MSYRGLIRLKQVNRMLRKLYFNRVAKINKPPCKTRGVRTRGVRGDRAGEPLLPEGGADCDIPRRPTAPSRACPLLPALCHTQDLGASSALAILLSGRRLGHRPPGRGQVRPATPSPAPRASTAQRSPVPGAFPDFTDGRSLRSHAPHPPRRHGPESSAGQAHTPVPRSHG